MTPAGKLARERARREFVALVERGIEEDDLGRAALLIAEEEEPSDDGRDHTAHCLGVLDELGGRAREVIAAARDANDDKEDYAPVVRAFNDFMFATEGFVGNTGNYYDPRNSLLTHVVERRTGIPITLSVIYMEVGRRAGLTIEGVGMPGHFIVRVRAGADVSSHDDGILVDPFWGKVIDRDECQERLDVIYGGQVALHDEHLSAVTTRQILIRMLQNLKGIYASANLDSEALGIVERLLLLAPDNLHERRDRGLLLARVGRYAEAARELEACIAAAPEGEDAEAAAEVLKRVRARLASFN